MYVRMQYKCGVTKKAPARSRDERAGGIGGDRAGRKFVAEISVEYVSGKLICEYESIQVSWFRPH